MDYLSSTIIKYHRHSILGNRYLFLKVLGATGMAKVKVSTQPVYSEKFLLGLQTIAPLNRLS